MPPPDPKTNRQAYNNFIDLPSNWPVNMNRASLDAENGHWAKWLSQNNYVGQPPEPGRALKIVGGTTTAAGVLLTGLGALGKISIVAGVASTWGGIGIMVLGYTVGAMSKNAIAVETDALTEVRLRMSAINTELERIAAGTRRG